MKYDRLASFALVAAVAWGMGAASAEPAPSKRSAEIEKLKKIALTPGVAAEHEKRQAVYAIRDLGGKASVAALLDLLGKAEPKSVTLSVIYSLSALGGEDAKLGLAGMADDSVVGRSAIREVARRASKEDVAVLKKVLSRIEGKAATLPTRNVAEALALFRTTAYKPAAPFVRRLLSSKDRRVRKEAIRAIGRVGDAKDLKGLWQVAEASRASRDLGPWGAAIDSIGELGAPGDAGKLRSLARSIRGTTKPGDRWFLELRDVMAARAAIVARNTHAGMPVVTATVKPVSGGAEIAAALPEGCAGLLVTIADGKHVLARGLVRGEKVVKVSLPAGPHTVTLRPIAPSTAKWLQRYMHLASNTSEPEALLQTGKTLTLKSVEARGQPATAAAIVNAVSPAGVDRYAKRPAGAGAAQPASAVAALQGTLVRYPGSGRGGPPGPRENPLPTMLLMKRGLKLCGPKTFVYLASGGSGGAPVPPGSQAVVVGMFCRAWDGKAYLFVALDAWPVDPEDGKAPRQ